jgi:hypothetical protein
VDQAVRELGELKQLRALIGHDLLCPDGPGQHQFVEHDDDGRGFLAGQYLLAPDPRSCCRGGLVVVAPGRPVRLVDADPGGKSEGISELAADRAKGRGGVEVVLGDLAAGV